MMLAQEFPLLVGDRIPQDDEHWYSFLVLLKICNIAISPVCNYDTIAYLRVLIEEKLYLFKQLYPTQNLIPKHHYMIHYPSQMLRLGPLIHTWNMRQESKLSFIKRVSRRGNYKNVCKLSLESINFGFAIRFNLLQVYCLVSLSRARNFHWQMRRTMFKLNCYASFHNFYTVSHPSFVNVPTKFTIMSRGLCFTSV